MPCISATRRYTFLFFLLVSFCLIASILRHANASEPNPPKYDSQTETKLKGTVQDITLPGPGHGKEIVRLVMKVGNDAIDVYLCPKSFLDEMGVEFNKGDEVAITGSKVKQGDTDLVLARQAQKGNDTLILRDDKGNPVWAWGSNR